MPMLDHRSGLLSLQQARPPRWVRWFARSLAVGFVLVAAGLLFLPWRQFVSGSGRIVAYDPLERAVTVEAPLAGRVLKAKVLEGQNVAAGDVLFELIDNDANLQANLQRQREAMLARRDATRTRVDSLQAQLRDQERALPLAIAAARTRLAAAKVTASTATQQYDRIKALFEDQRGLASQRDYELALLERDRQNAELERAQAELDRTPVDLQASISGTTAQRDSARAELASVEQSLVVLDIQISQTQMQRVTAPRAGIVFRVQATEGTFLRAGSPLCTIIAKTETRMAELWLNGLDMPLLAAREVDATGKVVREGSLVRLQFEGWPALQLAGWPSLARGTFGGEVLMVDPTDNGKGKFRVLIAEKPDVVQREGGRSEVIRWPAPRWLRQGVRVNGWVLLQQVPLWFEVWRQMNGFPPVLTEDQLDSKK
jgi:multidrug efflux pump subunit AcrA (membrane-fusion protein)